MEFETAADLKKAVEALDGREFKEHRVTCTPNVGSLTLDLFSVLKAHHVRRLSPISPATAEVVLALQVADPTLRVMIGTGEVLLPVVLVHAGTVTATDTVREVHDATTTTTGLDTDHLLVAVQWRNTQSLLVAMTTRTAEITLLLTHT